MRGERIWIKLKENTMYRSKEKYNEYMRNYYKKLYHELDKKYRNLTNKNYML